MNRFLIAIVSLFLSSCSEGVPVSPTLIGGRVPSKGDFQAVIFSGGCTNTLVGSRAVLTAAHCVNTSMVFSVGRDSFKAECRIPKEYSDGDISADNSLCFLEREVKGIEFESLDITDSVSTGDQVLLSGFGCTKKGGPTDGIFRIGEAIVSTKSTRMGDGYFVTRKPVANLCPGDSGGPCWSMKDGKRVSVIGNNSRSDLENYSYIASTSAKSFVRFLAAWKKIHPEARICGVDLDAKGCRGAKTPTKPQTEFELDHEVAWVGVIMKPQYVPVLEKFRRIVEAALGSLVPSR